MAHLAVAILRIRPTITPVWKDEPMTTATLAIDATFGGLPPLLSVDKAAGLLGISRSSAYRYVKSGELPSRRLGGRLYVLTSGLRSLVEVA
jgi:excisionase family DNA binding protein